MVTCAVSDDSGKPKSRTIESMAGMDMETFLQGNKRRIELLKEKWNRIRNAIQLQPVLLCRHIATELESAPIPGSASDDGHVSSCFGKNRSVKVWIIGVCLLVGAVVLFGSRSIVPLAPAVPRLQVSSTTLDLGDGKPNQIMRGVLGLHNTGTAPLEFSIARS